MYRKLKKGLIQLQPDTEKAYHRFNPKASDHDTGSGETSILFCD